MSRPSKLNDDVLKEVGRCIRLGMSYAATAAAIHVSADTFYNWMSWGKNSEKDKIYARLYATVKENEAFLMEDCLIRLRKVADTGNLEALKFILSRKFPQEFGSAKEININQKLEAVQVNITSPSTVADAEALRARILQKLTPHQPDRLNVTNGTEEL